ncbi:MAG: L,D-transpeptidase [Myxococcota bacterium]
MKSTTPPTACAGWRASFILAIFVGCAGGASPEPPEADAPPAIAEGETPEVEAEAADEEAEAEPAEPAGPPKRIFAKRFVVPVRAAPSREADRIGYLRAGAVLEATTAEPVGFERCRGGWYELTTGGFVCNERHVIAFEGRRLPERRAKQPSLEEPLPYEYGFIRRRVPMYRRPPNDEEAMEYENWRPPGMEPAEGEGEGGAAEGAASAEASPMAAEAAAPSMEPPPPAMEAPAMVAEAPTMDAPAPTMDAPAPTMDAPAAPSMAPAPVTGAEVLAAVAADGEEPEEDEGPTLDTLMGDPDSVVMRWLMRGFYVSLDRGNFRRNGRRYWRTQANGFVPYTAVNPRAGSEFQGVELGEEVTLPYAFVVRRRNVVRYRRTDAGRFRRAPGRVRFHEGHPVLETVEDGRETYYRVDEEHWLRDRDLRVAMPGERPSEIGEGEKWLDIDLTTQTLVAYEGERPVYVTLISSGQKNVPSREEDWETLRGLFRVKSKHLTDTMDGDTAVDGPYSVDDVPYVQYFELAYALHGAFWHNSFGAPRSHGCVNLAPLDSRWVFGFTDPPLPEGWHSAYPTEDVGGTWIWVHGDMD